MTATDDFVQRLATLQPGSLGLLRSHAGQRLNESVHAFDLFAGLWWPLRDKNSKAPRREVAWLVAKLYAHSPLPHSRGDTLARQLRRCQPRERVEADRFRQRFDGMIGLSVRELEPALQWALDLVASQRGELDWVKLTDDLSGWHRDSVRVRWTEQFLGIEERGKAC